MKGKRAKRPDRGATALTLVEVVVAMAILAIAALGSLSYQYHAAVHSRIANAQVAATRIAQLLLEDWKSTGGSDKYKPSDLKLGFSAALSVPSDFTIPSGLGTTLNNAVYAITIDNLPMLVMLKYKDVAQDLIAQVTLRQVAVIARFGASSAAGGPTSIDDRLKKMPPVVLTTYVRVDAASG